MKIYLDTGFRLYTDPMLDRGRAKSRNQTRSESLVPRLGRARYTTGHLSYGKRESECKLVNQ